MICKSPIKRAFQKSSENLGLVPGALERWAAFCVGAWAYKSTIVEPRFLSTLGNRDALQSWRDRDPDTFNTPAKGVSFVLTTTHRTLGEGWSIPTAGTASPKPSGMG